MGDQPHAPAALPPGKNPDTHRTGGWVGPRAGLDGCEKKLAPTGIRSPERSSCNKSLLLLLILLLNFENIFDKEGNIFFQCEIHFYSSTYIHSGQRASKCLSLLTFFSDNYCSDVIFDKYTFTFNRFSTKINVMALYQAKWGKGGQSPPSTARSLARSLAHSLTRLLTYLLTYLLTLLYLLTYLLTLLTYLLTYLLTHSHIHTHTLTRTHTHSHTHTHTHTHTNTRARARNHAHTHTHTQTHTHSLTHTHTLTHTHSHTLTQTHTRTCS